MYEYFQTIVNNFEKNSTFINSAMEKDDYIITELIYAVAGEKVELSWFKLIFDLYDKMNKAPTREDFEIALKNDNFSKLSKECQEIIKQKYNKFYPK